MSSASIAFAAPGAPALFEKVDTASTVQIDQDPVVMVGMILLTLAFIGGGLWLIFGDNSSARSVIVGWFATTTLAFFAVLAAVRLVTLRNGPVLTVSPAGIRDERFSSDTIPWSDIRSVRSTGMFSGKTLLVSLAPGADKKLKLKPVAAVLRGVNSALTGGGVTIVALGLKASFTDLKNLLGAFAAAHVPLDRVTSSSRPAR